MAYLGDWVKDAEKLNVGVLSGLPGDWFLVDQIEEQRKRELEAEKRAREVSELTATLTTARAELNAMCENLLGVKGASYAHSVLDNETGQRFKKAAVELGITPIQVAMVYASKHWASIQKWVQDGCKENLAGTEPIEGRIADLRNYLDFIYYLRKDGGK